MNKFKTVAALLCAGLLLAHGAVRAQLRTVPAAEQALDRAAFQGAERELAERLTDVQSVVVLVRGRVAFEFYRDGAPGKLREIQSVRKSALSLLVGAAIGQGKLALDQPVLALMPEWAPLNRDPRAAAITVRHLLSFTAGFEFNDPAGITGGNMRPTDAWARPLASAPGEKFGYDNALIPMLTAVLEKATGQPATDYARQQLVAPLGLAEPGYERGVQMRTMDLAKLGQLVLQGGLWEGKQIVPADYVRASTEPQGSGGPPVGLPYGYLWWVAGAQGPQRVVLASGYAGQMIWVHPGLELVVAATSTVSADSQKRGHAIALLRSLVPAARDRAQGEAR